MNFWRTHQLISTAVVLLIGVAAGIFLYTLSHYYGNSAADAYRTMLAHGAGGPVTTASEPDAVAGDIRGIDFSQLLSLPASQKVESVNYADLRGNGSLMAIVRVRDDGDTRPLEWYLYELSGGQPVRVFERHEVAQGEVKIDGPRIIETEGVYAPGDADCCPSSTRQTVYVWQGDALVVSRVDAVPPGAGR